MARKFNKTMLKPVHPGEVLRADFLEPLDISLYRLAKETGVSAQQWGRIVSGARSVTADTALRLARYFGTSAKVWMSLQTQYDLDVAEDELGQALKKTVP